MGEIPPFEAATDDFKRFLSSRGHPSKLVWVFRDDIWRKSRVHMLVRWPVRPGAPSLAEEVYAQGRSRGIVGIQALAQTPHQVFATVWFPKFAEDEVQGWTANLKLMISDPLAQAHLVRSALWLAIRCMPSYRRYQAWEHGVGTRKWGAA